MLELSLKHIGHGLEAAVRMVGGADRLAGPIIGRAHLVDEQEGIDMAEPSAREGAPHDEAAAFSLAMRLDDACDGAVRILHVALLELNLSTQARANNETRRITLFRWRDTPLKGEGD